MDTKSNYVDSGNILYS